MNEPEELREPSLNELCRLNLLCNVAYAVRCARRMQPRFKPPAEMADAHKLVAIVDAAIGWAEEFAGKGEGDRERGTTLAETASHIADAISEQTDYSAYAAYHAVRGALLVAQAETSVSEEVYLEVVAAAYGSSRVLVTNAPPWIHALVMKTLRDDYEKLIALTMQHASEKGEPLDVTATGPLGGLWPGKTPVW